ncbi:hypothetical protein K505DRAFT_252145, partial [Melanomma pulvis-pyrius CBS 109.77]
PEDICPICCIEFAGSSAEDLVIEFCRGGHPFHAECLENWVNGSAMPNVSTCPVDREEICYDKGEVASGRWLR